MTSHLKFHPNHNYLPPPPPRRLNCEAIVPIHSISKLSVADNDSGPEFPPSDDDLRGWVKTCLAAISPYPSCRRLCNCYLRPQPTSKIDLNTTPTSPSTVWGPWRQIAKRCGCRTSRRAILLPTPFSSLSTHFHSIPLGFGKAERQAHFTVPVDYCAREGDQQ